MRIWCGKTRIYEFYSIFYAVSILSNFKNTLAVSTGPQYFYHQSYKIIGLIKISNLENLF